jgi:hypothetical protein
MSEDPKAFARAHRQAAQRNPAKAKQHNLAADILDPPPPVVLQEEPRSRGSKWVPPQDIYKQRDHTPPPRSTPTWTKYEGKAK